MTEQQDLSEHQSPAADPRKSRPQSRWASLAIIGAAGWLLSLGGARAVIELDREALRVDFERRTGNFMAFLQTDVVQDYTQSNQALLTGLHRIMEDDALTEERLAGYAAETENSDFVRSSVVFLPRVPVESVPEFEAGVRQKSNADFTVREHNWDGGVGDSGYHARVHYPIVDFRTEQTDIDLLGYDLASNLAEETALELALSRGYPLSFGYTTEEGILTFIHLLPVKKDFKHPLVDDATCEGFVGVLTETSLGGLSEFFPLAMSGIDAYLISSPGRRRRADDTSSPAALIRASVSEAGWLAGGASIDMGGRHWDVVSTPRAELTEEHATNTPGKIAGLILVLTLAIVAIVARAQSRARRVEDLVARRTAELSAANQDLAREVAERKKTEAALVQSQEMYELLSSNVSDVIWTTDLNMQLSYISPSVKRLRGFTPNEARQQSIGEILTDESFSTVMPLMAEALDRVAAGENDPPPTYVLDLDMFCKDGAVVRTETTASVLLNAEREVVGFLGVTRDIEPRKRAEEEKSILETQLRQAQKMEAIGTLAGGVAHDFNNLLTGILGYSNLLKLQHPQGTDAYEAADVIETAAQRASDLTKQLLGFARQGKLQNAAVNLHTMISESVALLRRTIDKSIDIVLRMDAEDPEVMGDPSQLQLVVLNLAVNARDAMPEGGELTIETDNVVVAAGALNPHPDLKPGDYVRMRVSDTGIGVPEGIRERVFEPFFTTKSTGEGTGMGLATVYGIVKNHDGLVYIADDSKRTTFEVLLPFAGTTERPDLDASEAAPVQGRGKVLVVEDEEVVRRLASEILAWLGYETVTVCDGVEALEYYNGHKDDIDVALIDLNMPRMGGRECYEKMKAINPNLRAVLSTGYSRDGAAQELLDEGVQGFVQKPFQAGQLSEAIAQALK